MLDFPIWVFIGLFLLVSGFIIYIYINKTKTKKDWSKSDFWSYDPYEFEKLVGELYKSKGYSVDVSDGSGDKGVDVHAKRRGEYLTIQVKQYRNNIGSSVVQRTAGASLEFDSDRAVVVTTSKFSKDAVESAKKIDRADLVDGDDLVRMLNNNSVSF